MDLIRKFFSVSKYFGFSIYKKEDVAEYTTLFNMLRERTMDIEHNHIGYSIPVPNALCKYRAETFSTKEPETLAWMDSFDRDSFFWDIGANIGLYSIYAAKTKNCKVYAFEPSVFNLEMLARNIHVNKLSGQISILPLALSNQSGFGLFKMSSTEIGGALSTFDKPYGYDGKPLNNIFEYTTLSLSMDEALTYFNLSLPQYIKIDVDGIEHLILSGGEKVLKNVKSLLIEISNSFEEQKKDVTQYLENAGLTLHVYDEAELNRYNLKLNDPTVNQIWIRK